MTNKASGRIYLRCHYPGCWANGSVWFDNTVERQEGRREAVTWMCNQHQTITPGPGKMGPLPVRRERVGWVRYDGDEYHDFRYASPDDRHNLAVIERDYLPVYVDNPFEGGRAPASDQNEDTHEGGL